METTGDPGLLAPPDNKEHPSLHGSGAKGSVGGESGLSLLHSGNEVTSSTPWCQWNSSEALLSLPAREVSVVAYWEAIIPTPPSSNKQHPPISMKAENGTWISTLTVIMRHCLPNFPFQGSITENRLKQKV